MTSDDEYHLGHKKEVLLLPQFKDMNTRAENFKADIFNKLFGEEWKEVYDAFRLCAVYRQFRSGQFLFRKGDLAPKVHLILDGVARVHTRSQSSGSLIIRFLKEGDMAGIMEAFNEMPHQYNAMVHSKELSLCSLDRASFLDLLRDFPVFGMQVMKQVDRDASFIEMRLADIRSQRVVDRIEGMMRAMSEKFGLDDAGQIDLDITPSNIAQMIGATRTTVYRSLKQLEEEGVLEIKNHRIRPMRPMAI